VNNQVLPQSVITASRNNNYIKDEKESIKYEINYPVLVSTLYRDTVFIDIY
jgi:hypothetical protein